jgi:hypothetical protein
MNTSDPTAIFSGVAGVGLLIVALIITIAWVFLPFRVVSWLSKIHREAESQTALLESLLIQAKKSAAKPAPPKDAAQKKPPPPL